MRIYNSGEALSKEVKKVEEEDKIKKALLKKALGYSADEVLLERYYKTYEDKVLAMSDEELSLEQERLKNLLKGESDGD